MIFDILNFQSKIKKKKKKKKKEQKREIKWQLNKMKSLFPKPFISTPDMLLICIIDFLLQLNS